MGKEGVKKGLKFPGPQRGRFESRYPLEKLHPFPHHASELKFSVELRLQEQISTARGHQLHPTWLQASEL